MQGDLYSHNLEMMQITLASMSVILMLLNRRIEVFTEALRRFDIDDILFGQL